MKRTIPVVWGVDEKYVLQAFVVMHSILQHSSEEFLFFLITADDVSKKVAELNECLSKKYQNYEMKVINIGKHIFSGAKIHCKHLSVASYFRLLIPDLLPQCNKCIYLDSDVIVNGDLKELFEVPMEEFYIAGVKDCHIIRDNIGEYEHQKMMGIPSRNTYINAGVMLMNLYKLRNDKMVERFMEQVKRENRNEDQDVLNVCCYGAIKVLPLKYNLFQFYTGVNIRNLFDLSYTENDFAFDWNAPFILHTGGIYKSWVCERFKGSKEWWNLAEIFSGTSVYCTQREQKVGLELKKYDFKVVLDECKKSNKIAIWGYSPNGRRCLDSLLSNGITEVVAFVDNNDSYRNCRYNGVRVAEPMEIWKQYRDIRWIITSEKYYEEIKAQLMEMGVAPENITNYVFNKPRVYYLALLPEYYDSEIMDICSKEFCDEMPNETERECYIKTILANPRAHMKEYMYLFYKYRLDLWLEQKDYANTYR